MVATVEISICVCYLNFVILKSQKCHVNRVEMLNVCMLCVSVLMQELNFFVKSTIWNKWAFLIRAVYNWHWQRGGEREKKEEEKINRRLLLDIPKKMVEMSKSRCILYFDELDKACSKHGSMNEITSILIHLTDPNMNKNFQDRFFQGIDFPLNKVIFIFSYNDSKLIDPILLDRIKEIKINPYTLSDKLEICQNYVIPEIKKNIAI